MSHDLQNYIMLNGVKSFSKIQLKNDDLFLALLALVDVFKAPGYAVLNCLVSDNTILIFVQKLKDDLL